MSILYAGPWIGEFGWQLCCWQGFIRKQSRNFDKTIIICEKEYNYLYKDFATDFININSPGTERDSENCLSPRREIRYYPNLTPYDMWIKPSQLRSKGYVKFSPEDCPYIEDQEYIKYGSFDKSLEYDIVIHARNTNKCNSSERNWPEKYWRILLSAFSEKKICFIGSQTDSLYIKDHTDKRGIGLEELANLITSSKLMIGPSSGPMHLSSLCRTPHLVWTGDKKNIIRYTKLWNPFDTHCTIMDPERFGWQPDPHNVIRYIEDMI